MSRPTGSEAVSPPSPAAPAPAAPARKILGIHPLKIVFAMEYVLQGLANPFQGITYQPFFRHFRTDYGLSEAATQGLFAKSYLAWSFKPLLGFLIDAYGRTKVILLVLLSLGALGFLLTPIIGFWRGLNSGPILGVILFYFIFHFQPAMGALWTNYLIESLGFSPTQIGISDGVSYAGYFLGVLLFAWKGVKWQDRIGLRKIFRLYILLSVAINLTQYLQVDPWFSAIAHGLNRVFPFLSEETARLVYLSAFNGFLAIGVSLIRMSTFSLVGAIIPVAAAGSLFAGFMSVSNLAYSFSYSSGAWLYTHGLEFGFMRTLQGVLFGISGVAGGELSINMLILIGSLAYFLSFVTVHLLPDRRQTLATELDEQQFRGPERWQALSAGWKRGIDAGSLALGLAFGSVAVLRWQFDVVSAVLIAFFGISMLRKAVLDLLLRAGARSRAA